MNNSKSKNEQSITNGNGLVAKHVFSENGSVFIRSSQNVETDEWSVINFYWMPVLRLERELR